ncbi:MULTISPECIES: cobyrinate a,c-diamide synthase [unclassified Oceanispirochaeta]|uniref:cobyrinate a,c-diamide synthase n=1 Tax=unclassified Oceanispirochaeta TaxID=2635722 RepID=UPI000E09C64A|nr:MULTISPECIES: cobyrinate a,c-diamide synthase [unclassified Oceanispirochaeta]MBF9014807.1 cobyrinate a,c-diamide synthase [Oceanispirochaeta sp. M2]NPD71063.1 cobyrinate a,c-diamide synthase [Oceanispirochaeta sp. M1]RDG33896.1 cobyrinate a,c-diamide synthase [Oceanispirochaeta sp. M1]
MKNKTDSPPATMKGFMVAGTHSGCGKSTVAMGLNRLLSRQGYRLQPWKCGPDYIDPGFHSIAAGRNCRNLDTRLMNINVIKELFSYHGGSSDFSLVEGVMGYYDGDSGRFIEGSSYHLSKVLGLPVFLVLDVRAMAQSAGALAAGFSTYRDDAPIAGFILNRTGSERHSGMVRDAVEEATGKPVIGCLPRQDDISLPERHLGLVLAEEQRDDLCETLDKIADSLEKNLDMEKLLSLSFIRSTASDSIVSGRENKPVYLPGISKKSDNPVIAVAKDKAFAFYYQDNLDLLENRGARLAYFSPVSDKSLPQGTAAVYFGGGYPELFARELSENKDMLGSVRQAASEGMPIYGECGGYMYLAESLRCRDGSLWPMAGLLPGKISMSGGLRALGYGDVRWLRDTFLADKGTVIPGHLFHWSSLEEELKEELKEEALFEMDRRGSLMNEGFMQKNVLASYVHFHFASRPDLALRFVEAAQSYSKKNKLS